MSTEGSSGNSDVARVGRTHREVMPEHPEIPGNAAPHNVRFIDRIENGANLIAILLLGLMPVLEIATRTIFRG